jgi:2-methylcitrate dehydratase PrpD
VARVRIRTFHNATRLAGHEPKTLDEFTYAIAFPVATMIVRGKIGVEELSPEMRQDPEILRVSRVTDLVETEHYTRISTRKRWADLTLYLTDGRVLESPARTPVGDPDDPLSDAEIRDKFRRFADPVLGEARARTIEAVVAAVDEPTTDVGRVLDLVCGRPAGSGAAIPAADAVAVRPR